MLIAVFNPVSTELKCGRHRPKHQQVVTNRESVDMEWGSFIFIDLDERCIYKWRGQRWRGNAVRVFSSGTVVDHAEATGCCVAKTLPLFCNQCKCRL